MSFILFLALVVVFILWLTSKKKLQKIISDLTSSIENLGKNYTNLQNEHISLNAKYSKLTKYEGLLDIEDKANEMLSNADKIIQEANRKAEEIA